MTDAYTSSHFVVQVPNCDIKFQTVIALCLARCIVSKMHLELDTVCFALQ